MKVKRSAVEVHLVANTFIAACFVLWDLSAWRAHNANAKRAGPRLVPRVLLDRKFETTSTTSSPLSAARNSCTILAESDAATPGRRNSLLPTLYSPFSLPKRRKRLSFCKSSSLDAVSAMTDRFLWLSKTNRQFGKNSVVCWRKRPFSTKCCLLSDHCASKPNKTKVKAFHNFRKLKALSSTINFYDTDLGLIGISEIRGILADKNSHSAGKCITAGG